MGRKDLLIGILFGTTMSSSIAGLLVVKKYEELNIKYKSVWSAGRYLCRMLERAEVEVDEFDLLAFKELGFPD